VAGDRSQLGYITIVLVGSQSKIFLLHIHVYLGRREIAEVVAEKIGINQISL